MHIDETSSAAPERAFGGDDEWALPEGVSQDMVRPSAWQKPWVGDRLLTATGILDLAWGRIAAIGALLVFAMMLMVWPLLLVGSGSGAMLSGFLLPMGGMFGAFAAGGAVGLWRGRRVYGATGDIVGARRAFGVASVTVSILLMTALLWAAMLTGRFLAGMPAFASFFGFWSVFVLVGLLTPVRVGPELRCGRCDYPFQTSHGANCPECGSRWGAPLSLVRGERKSTNLALVALLAAAVLPTAAVGFASVFGEGSRFMTTESLLRRAINPAPTDFIGPWDELNRRTLTEEQTLRLASGVMNYTQGTNFVAADEGMRWLAAKIIAGEIPGDMVHDLLDRRLSLSLQTTGTPGVGAPMVVTVDARASGDGGRSLHAVVAVGGYRVGDDAPVDRGAYFMPLIPAPFGQTISMLLASPLAVTPEAPGDIEVRFECWVYLVDRSHHGRIAWRPDGAPEPPPGALAEVHKEATTTLRVVSGP